MKNSSPSILFLSMLIFLSLSSSLSAKKPIKCHPHDQQAIQEIRSAFGLDPIADCCDWKPVVTCHKFSHQGTRVVNLIISNSDVSGQIPAAVGDLPYLKILIINNATKITGTLPPAVAKLSNLISLQVSSCNLYGPIPTFILRLKKLLYLDFSFNSLTGSIPSELSQFPKLQTLHLEGNKLTGTIPESLGNLPVSKGPMALFLQQNQLTGTVPKSLANLPFVAVDLSNNKLTGDPTFLFQNNTVIGNLNLSRNRFSFNFSNVVLPASMADFEVSHNDIFGGIPQQFTQLGLVGLDVSYNKLCGQIPQGGNLQSFRSEFYSHNKCLCGAPLPPCK